MIDASGAGSYQEMVFYPIYEEYRHTTNPKKCGIGNDFFTPYAVYVSENQRQTTTIVPIVCIDAATNGFFNAKLIIPARVNDGEIFCMQSGTCYLYIAVFIK